MSLSLNMTIFGQLFKRNYSSVSALYTKNHEWIKILQNVCADKICLRAKLGITDYSQKALGDIVFIDMPKIGTKYNGQGDKNY